MKRLIDLKGSANKKFFDVLLEMRRFRDYATSTENYANNVVEFFRTDDQEKGSQEAVLNARKILYNLVQACEQRYGIMNDKTMVFKCAYSSVIFLVSEKTSVSLQQVISWTAYV